MTIKIQVKRGTSSEWASENPTLSPGEYGLETDTNKLKIGNGVANWNSLQHLDSTTIINSQAGSYTLVLSDAGKLIEMNSGSPITLTIPADDSVNFSVGTKIDVFQAGAGQVTIDGSGFTPNSASGLNISAQWGTVQLIKLAEDYWLVSGDLSA